MTEPLTLSLTCKRCGATQTNDTGSLAIQSAFDFHEWLRAKGWRVMHHAAGGVSELNAGEERLCPKCVSSS